MKKMMFNDQYSLTQAVLDGRKTMTRRIIPNENIIARHFIDGDTNRVIIPKYNRGEVVAIAQSYKSFFGGFKACGNSVEYEGIWYDFDDLKAGWNNKMFVRADLMPHQIKITNVYIQRLQDISDEDCMREGVELNTRQFEYDGTRRYCVRGLGYWRGIGCDSFNTPKEAFATLIDKISGKGTWEKDPFVFVYEFELIK